MYFGDLYPSSQRISVKAAVTLASGNTPPSCFKDSVVASVSKLRTHWKYVTCENKLRHDLLCSIGCQDGGTSEDRCTLQCIQSQSPGIPRNSRDGNPPRENPRNWEHGYSKTNNSRKNLVRKSCVCQFSEQNSMYGKSFLFTVFTVHNGQQHKCSGMEREEKKNKRN